MRLCEYGCGKEAKYQFKNRKWCCSKHWTQCSISGIDKSNRMTGKKTGPRLDMIGDNNISKRPEVRKKLSGKNHWNYGREGYWKNKKRPEISGEKSRMYGKRAVNWNGGNIDYWSKELQKTNKECCLCKSSKSLEMHHKDHNDKNQERKNLIMLCRRCHAFWHFHKN